MGLGMDDALQFLETVKKRFIDSNPTTYYSFLDLVKKFKQGQVNLPDVKKEVGSLFHGHADLIQGFQIFLPSDPKNDVVPAEGAENVADEAVASSSRATQHNNLPASKVDFADAVRYVQRVKSRFGEKSDVFTNFMDLLTRYKEGLITINDLFAQAEHLFCNEPDLLEGLEKFLPDSTKDAIRTFRASGHRWRSDGHAYDAVENAVAKLKKNLRKTPYWQDVMRLLTLYTEGVLLKEEVLNLLNDLIGSSFPKTMKAVRAIMPQIRQADIDDDEDDIVDDDARDDPPPRNPFTTKIPTGTKAAKFWSISASEAAANCSIRCGPSYRQLPKEFPTELLRSSGRTEECKAVLNDTWMSVPSGSEDFKQRRKSQYEENLFRVEDDRYELDMLIETNKSAIRILEIAEADLAQRNAAAQQSSGQGGADAADSGPFHLEERLLPFHVKAIKRVYGDHGAEVMEHLKREPEQTIGIILARLKQKSTEWEAVKTEMNVPWLFSIRKSSSKK